MNSSLLALRVYRTDLLTVGFRLIICPRLNEQFSTKINKE